MPSDIIPSDSEFSESRQDKTPWIYLIIALLFIPLGALVYFLLIDNKPSVMVANAPVDCNLQEEPCQAVFSNGTKVTLSITPRPIREREQLHFRVWIKGVKAKTVYVNFLGENMYMGYNRPRLQNISPGEFTGTWALTSCGLFVEHMQWNTAVLIQTANQRMAARFSLDTQPLVGNQAQ